MSTDILEERVCSLEYVCGFACYPLYTGFWLRLFFHREDGGDMFVRNVG
jgi:hypothetical protein